MENIDVLMTDLDISNEENEELIVDDDLEEVGNRFELCLVGRFLSEKSINVRAMKTKLADLWKPAMGITIRMLKEGIFLFQFYHKDDMQWMVNNGPWSFDNTMLVTSVIPVGEDPLKVDLNEIDFWIQIYDLPSGFMTESVGKQLGNFFGSFVLYDPSNNASIWREYMRIRIKLDVRFPLKRKKKISRRNKSEFIVNCKYEKLGDFCFVCGLLTHTERFCKKRLEGESSTLVREWGSWLRAPPRRAVVQERSKWLRGEKEGDWGVKKGSDKNQGFQNEDKSRKFIKVVNAGTDSSGNGLGGVIVGKELEGNKFLNVNDGPGNEELSGLDLEERKRKRLGPKDIIESEMVVNTNPTDSVFSNTDYAGTSQTYLAQLALQASQPQ